MERGAVNGLFRLPTEKYLKEDKLQLVERRRKKEAENLDMADVEEFLQAPYLNDSIDVAVACHVDEVCRPCAIQDFTDLRDVLISIMLVKSLRRLLEFTEFRLSEYASMDMERETYVIRIARHKTAAQGQNPLS